LQAKRVFRPNFVAWAGVRERRGLAPTSDRTTNPGRKRRSEKKWPLRRAAKFREETPRKGGGFAIEDRNTALQQYEEDPICLQGQSGRRLYQNAAENLGK
jgi:hypothetical protein